MDPRLTPQDSLVLSNLEHSAKASTTTAANPIDGSRQSLKYDEDEVDGSGDIDKSTLKAIDAINDVKTDGFEPTIFVTWDFSELNCTVRTILDPYIKWARHAARHQTDVVMVTHLLLYFSTSVPSAIYLYHNFTYLHGFLHWFMQSWYVGTYTLMRHQHIHQGGVLAKRVPYNLVDAIYPYVLDPLHGHTWNSYFYHHVKHHHVEGNGPDDLSSTLRYQRDSFLHFLCYLGRFFFFIWFDLPQYFVRKRRYTLALKAWGWETLTLASIAGLAYWQLQPTIFVLMLPLTMTRIGLMVGNWGQHALVDEVEPNSDFRSSITLIDVASNRFCFNDGYHTSHHLNPLRHWRDHPRSLVAQKQRYSDEGALIFKDIDYIMMTVRLFMKDYETLARCLVPIGDQVDLSMGERAELLRRKTRRFTEEEIQEKFSVHVKSQ